MKNKIIITIISLISIISVFSINVFAENINIKEKEDYIIYKQNNNFYIATTDEKGSRFCKRNYDNEIEARSKETSSTYSTVIVYEFPDYTEALKYIEQKKGNFTSQKIYTTGFNCELKDIVATKKGIAKSFENMNETIFRDSKPTILGVAKDNMFENLAKEVLAIVGTLFCVVVSFIGIRKGIEFIIRIIKEV